MSHRTQTRIQATVGLYGEQRDRRTAFTLMEALIAMGLMIMLMSGLYAAMTIYLNLQIDSHEEVARTQIARTLMRQLTRDIQSVVFTKQDTTEESDAETSEESTEATGTGTGTTTETAATPEAAASGTVTYNNGLLGTSTDLVLYISRPDRSLNYVSSQELMLPSDRTGDLMMVRYFIAQTGSSGIASDLAKQQLSGSDSGSAGLVRMMGDLNGLSIAMQENEEQDQMSAAKIMAPEVRSISFRYYDGAQWQEEWDSTALNLLPTAIEITLVLFTPEPADQTQRSPSEDPYALPDSKYVMVVNLPVAEPYVPESAL